MDIPSYESISSILVYFDANAYDPEQLSEDINSMNEQHVMSLKTEMKYLLDKKLLDGNDFYRATACTARDEKSARKFFEDVYKYAFEDGEEPDLTDYWNRPKPAYWEAPN